MLEIVGWNVDHIFVTIIAGILGLAALSCLAFSIYCIIVDDVGDSSDWAAMIGINLLVIALSLIPVVPFFSGFTSNAAYRFEGEATYVGMETTWEDGRELEKPVIEIPGAVGVSGPQRDMRDELFLISLEPGQEVPVSCEWFDNEWKCEVK